MWDMRKDSWVLKEEYNNKQMVKVRVLTKAQLASEIHIFILGRKNVDPKHKQYRRWRWIAQTGKNIM